MKRRPLTLAAIALACSCLGQTALAQYGAVQVQVGGYGPGVIASDFGYGNAYGNGYYGVYNNGYGNVYYNGYGQSYLNSYPQGYGYYRQSRVVYPNAYNYSGYSYRTYPGMGYGYGRVRYYSSFR